MERLIIFFVMDLTIAALCLVRRRKKYVTEKDMKITAHKEVII